MFYTRFANIKTSDTAEQRQAKKASLKTPAGRATALLNDGIYMHLLNSQVRRPLQ